MSVIDAGRPAVIRDRKWDEPFVAERAVLDASGWLHATGRRHIAQAGELDDIQLPVQERSWSPAERLSVEWSNGA